MRNIKSTLSFFSDLIQMRRNLPHYFKSALRVMIIFSLVTCTATFATAPANDSKFISAWGAGMYEGLDSFGVFIWGFLCGSNVACNTGANYSMVGYSNQTIRMIIHPTVSGNKLRVKLSNVYGQSPLTIGAARIGIVDHDAKIISKSNTKLTFNGNASTIIPVGQVAYSDSIVLPYKQGGNLAISLYFPNATGALTHHMAAFQTSYVSTITGDRTSAVDMGTNNVQITSWHILSGLEVKNDSVKNVVVAYGDSITDGAGSTLNANARYTDALAARLNNRAAVVNEGIGGSDITFDVPGLFGPSALHRFNVDVLGQSGETGLVLLYGTNDLANGVSAIDIINGLTSIITQAHTAGMAVVCGTIPPAEFYIGTGAGNVERLSVNTFLRATSLCDSVADFDVVLRDPTNFN